MDIVKYHVKRVRDLLKHSEVFTATVLALTRAMSEYSHILFMEQARCHAYYITISKFLKSGQLQHHLMPNQ